MSPREIAGETGLNRRTVSKYLKDPASAAPLIDAMLGDEVLLKASVIHERLVRDCAATINHQRVKPCPQEARPPIAKELGISPGEPTGL
ncbi:hypothetical protein GCM10019016_103960 [Streptomyces prasinosporus]|uniref:Uncharacterized protein n=1 Tax=Streptomyces prasinosporus TaxID=68256 RepID=A0ABP6U6G3_9ACTN